MYRNVFDKEHLIPKKIPQAILLYGMNHFLIDYYARNILLALNALDHEIHRLYFDEYDFKNLQSLLGAKSLFAERNIVLLKLEKKIPKKELKDLLARLTRNPDAYLILAFYPSDNRDLRSYNSDCKELEEGFKQGVSVRFFPLTYQESIGMLKTLAHSLGLNIHDKYLIEIFQIQNGDFLLIESDLKKLAILNRKIESSDIHELIYGVANLGVDNLCLCLFERKDSLAIVQNILDVGMGAREVIHSMQSFFMKLFLVFCHSKIYGQVNMIEVLGYKPPIHIERQYKELSIRLKENDYQQIFEILQSTLLGSLKGGSDPYQELYSCLIKLQAIFK